MKTDYIKYNHHFSPEMYNINFGTCNCFYSNQECKNYNLSNIGDQRDGQNHYKVGSPTVSASFNIRNGCIQGCKATCTYLRFLLKKKEREKKKQSAVQFFPSSLYILYNIP